MMFNVNIIATFHTFSDLQGDMEHLKSYRKPDKKWLSRTKHPKKERKEQEKMMKRYNILLLMSYNKKWSIKIIECIKQRSSIWDENDYLHVITQEFWYYF